MPRKNDEIIGDVFFRDFDEGIYITLMGQETGGRYYLPTSYVKGVVAPLFPDGFPGAGSIMPGIPMTFANSSDTVTRYVYPCIRIKREDPNPAMERMLMGGLKYRAKAEDAQPVVVQYGQRTVNGWSKYVEQEQPTPEDIPYTITCEAAGKQARSFSNMLLRHCMRVFYPKGKLKVVDSMGRDRLYWVIAEGPSDLSGIADVRDRAIVYALSLRVKGEIDLRDPVQRDPVTHRPTVQMHRRDEYEE